MSPEVLREALRGLSRSVDLLTSGEFPAVPMPRPRYFWIAAGARWPAEGPDWRAVEILGQRYSLHLSFGQIVEYILAVSRREPDLLAYACRRIHEAARWCRSRVRGLQRARMEVLCQQKSAMDTLYVELYAWRLARGG